MRIIEDIVEMQRWSEAERSAGRRIVFVPTMGYLHEGHLSLVRDGKRRGDRLVVSIFVNPTQFGPNEDYAAYPRDATRDRELLEKEGVDILFSPAAEAMYPEDSQTSVEVSRLSDPLCGGFRPGHFRGVATVVAKLFNIVKPHVAVFGEKDYQQLQVIRRLGQDLNFDVEIASHPTVRENDGLAMSSRNAYLSREERSAALALYRALERAQALVDQGERQSARIAAAAGEVIGKEPLARVEYIEVCDAETLEAAETIDRRALLALAVRIGRTRLIDNTVLRGRREGGDL
jgi:pantoate--beta-alanine ligase